MSLETPLQTEHPLDANFINLAKMHIKYGNLKEAEKVMQSAIKAHRLDDAGIISQLLDASRD